MVLPLAPVANQLYTEGLCQTHSSNGTGGFLATLIKEQFPKLLGTVGTSIFTSEIAGAKSETDCTAATASAQPETGGLGGKAVVTFTGCTVPKPKEGCKVKSSSQPVGTIVTAKLMGTLSSTRLITITPETGGVFFEIEYSGEGKCPVERKNRAHRR